MLEAERQNQKLINAVYYASQYPASPRLAGLSIGFDEKHLPALSMSSAADPRPSRSLEALLSTLSEVGLCSCEDCPSGPVSSGQIRCAGCSEVTAVKRWREKSGEALDDQFMAAASALFARTGHTEAPFDSAINQDPDSH